MLKKVIFPVLSAIFLATSLILCLVIRQDVADGYYLLIDKEESDKHINLSKNPTNPSFLDYYNGKEDIVERPYEIEYVQHVSFIKNDVKEEKIIRAYSCFSKTEAYSHVVINGDFSSLFESQTQLQDIEFYVQKEHAYMRLVRGDSLKKDSYDEEFKYKLDKKVLDNKGKFYELDLSKVQIDQNSNTETKAKYLACEYARRWESCSDLPSVVSETYVALFNTISNMSDETIRKNALSSLALADAYELGLIDLEKFDTSITYSGKLESKTNDGEPYEVTITTEDSASNFTCTRSVTTQVYKTLRINMLKDHGTLNDLVYKICYEYAKGL